MGWSLRGIVQYSSLQYCASLASYLINGVVCAFFKGFYPQEHLQLKCVIVCLFLIMLSKMTQIHANASAIIDHGWLSSSSLRVFGGSGHKKTMKQFLQFIAEDNVRGMPYETVASY